MLKRVLAINLAALMVSLTATAQTRDGDVLQFSVTGMGEFTDNRDSLEDGTSAVSWSIRPELKMGTRPESLDLELVYAPSYMYRARPNMYQNSSELYHDLGLKVLKQVSPERTQLRFTDRLVYTDDPSVTQGGTTLRRDSSYLMNQMEAGMSHRILDSRTMLDLSLRHMLKAYDDSAVARESDETRVGGSAYLSRTMASRTTSVLGVLDLSQTDYKRVNGSERGFDSMTVSMGSETIMGTESALSKIQVSTRLGFQSVQYHDDALSNENSPAANLAVSAGNQFKIKGSVDYRIRESDVFPFASQTALDFGGGVEYDTKAFWTMSLFGTYHMGDYDVDTISPETRSAPGLKAVEGTETSVVITGNMTYRMDDNTSVAMTVRVEDVDSDVFNSFNRNTVMISATRKF